jgi:hypothetical protein
MIVMQTEYAIEGVNVGNNSSFSEKYSTSFCLIVPLAQPVVGYLFHRLVPVDFD